MKARSFWDESLLDVREKSMRIEFKFPSQTEFRKCIIWEEIEDKLVC